MELKFQHGGVEVRLHALLIEPYGIEICVSLQDVSSEGCLLIEPYGIEMRTDVKIFEVARLF